jgi:glycerol transport system permease protein
VILCVAFSAILPLMTVVNYSVQDIISPERRVFVGTEWFAGDARRGAARALLRQLTFSLAVLAGGDSAGHPAGAVHAGQGWKASAVLVVVALSLLIPWNVVGTIWQILAAPTSACWAGCCLGIDYNYTGNATDAWLTVLVMDVWHWTPLVALLCYAGCAPFPTPTTRPRASTAPASWRCSATSSCPRCAAC